RAARDGSARAIRPRHGRGHPGVLLLRRQAAREFADVPGAGDVEGKVAAPELVPDVGDLRAVDRRRPLALEDLAVEAQGAMKAGAAEVAVATVRAQQRLRLLYREHQYRIEFIQGQQHAVTLGPDEGLDAREHARPFRPGPGRLGKARLREQVASIEQQPRVDIPRHSVEGAANDVGVPDPGEIVARLHGRGARETPVQRLERLERDELRDPGIAELTQVRRRLARERGEQLLMSGGPGQLLDPYLDVGMELGEFGQ